MCINGDIWYKPQKRPLLLLNIFLTYLTHLVVLNYTQLSPLVISIFLQALHFQRGFIHSYFVL